LIQQIFFSTFRQFFCDVTVHRSSCWTL